MDLSDPTTAALEAARAIEKSGQQGAVYGGLALAVWGTPRETRDADFAVCHADVERILAALRSGGLDPRVNFRALEFGGNSVTRIELTGAGALEGFNVID